MVGPWPLAPHHDHLQYTHHIHLMERGQNRDITPYPYPSYISISLNPPIDAQHRHDSKVSEHDA